jgi:hypothetical protein
MELTVAFGANVVPTIALLALVAVALALIVNCVALSIVRMRVLFGMLLPPCRNMPAARLLVLDTVTAGLLLAMLPVK